MMTANKTPPPLRGLGRGIWIVLIFLTFSWGVLTGLTFALDDFLHPATLLFGWLTVVVLAATTWFAEDNDRE